MPIVSGPEGGDAAGIVFEAVKQATATGIDVLIVDTAGRLQNKRELMDELAKIRRVLGRLNPAAPHDVVLVLDATTGQNALSQIEVFKEVAGVTGLVMTKLDGTARGGVLVAAAEKYGLPIHAIGVGEGIDDLRPFDARRGGADHRGRRRGPEVSGTSTATEVPARATRRVSGCAIDYAPLAVFFAVDFLAARRPCAAALRGSWRPCLAARMPRRAWRSRGCGGDRRVHGRDDRRDGACRGGRLGRISPMLWISGALVLVFGGLTLYFHDERFIQMKPTIVYAMLRRGARLSGCATGRPLLQTLLESAYPGLTDDGLAQADDQLDDLLRRDGGAERSRSGADQLDFWVDFKFWGAIR